MAQTFTCVSRSITSISQLSTSGCNSESRILTTNIRTSGSGSASRDRRTGTTSSPNLLNVPMTSLRRAASSLRRQSANPLTADRSFRRTNVVRITSRTAAFRSHFKWLTSVTAASGNCAISRAAWRRPAASAFLRDDAGSLQLLSGCGLSGTAS